MFSSTAKIDIEKPRWDQSTYVGRAQHFLKLTNPLNVFATSGQLDKAKDIVTKYRYINAKYWFPICLLELSIWRLLRKSYWWVGFESYNQTILFVKFKFVNNIRIMKTNFSSQNNMTQIKLGNRGCHHNFESFAIIYHIIINMMTPDWCKFVSEVYR